MEYFLNFVLKFPKTTLFGIILISLVALRPLKNIEVGEVREDWLHKNDSVLQTYIQFQKSFATGEEVVLAYALPGGFTVEELDWQKQFCRRLDSIPGVVSTRAIASLDKYLKNRNDKALDSLLKAYPEVSGIMLSEDQSMTAVVVGMGKKGSFMLPTLDTIELFKKGIEALCDSVENERGAPVHRAGSIFASEKISESIGYDIALLFPLTVVFALIILFMTFRHWAYTIIPIIATGIAILWTMSLKGIFHSPLTPLSSTLFVLISVLGVADSLHLFTHLHAAMRSGQSREEALRYSFKRAGKACFYTSLTTTIGFLSLSLSSMPIIRDLGIYAGLGIVFAFITAMVSLPLSVAFVPTIPAEKELPLGRVTAWISRMVFEYPIQIVVGGAIFLMALFPAVGRSEVDSSIGAYLKKGSRIRRDIDTIEKKLNGLSSTELLISGKPLDFREKEALDSLWELHNQLKSDTDVSSLVSFASAFSTLSEKNRKLIGKKGMQNMYRKRLPAFMTTQFDTARVSIFTTSLTSKEQRAFFARVEKYARQAFPDKKIAITGVDMLTQITTEKIVKTQFESLYMAAAVIFIVMWILFGPRGGFVAMLVNLFPILGIFSMIGYVGFPLNIATATIAAVAIGVVVDDTIHYHFAFKRGLKKGLSTEDALKTAHKDVGEAMIVSSLIIIAGVLLFLFAKTGLMVQFGILAAVAMLMALIADLFWGPALLLLLYRNKEKS